MPKEPFDTFRVVINKHLGKFDWKRTNPADKQLCLRAECFCKNDLNKENLRDLIAATGPVILLKLDSNHRFFSPCDLKFDGWPRKIIGHLLSTTSSFVNHFNTIYNSNLSYSPETLNSCQNRQFFVSYDLEIWRMTLENNRAPLLCYFKLCASFCSH